MNESFDPDGAITLSHVYRRLVRCQAELEDARDRECLKGGVYPALLTAVSHARHLALTALESMPGLE